MTDLVTVVDLFSGGSSGIRISTITDALTVTDQIIRSAMRDRLATDVISISEQVVSTVLRNILSEDVITVEDATSLFRRLSRRIQDELNVSDEFAISLLFAVFYDVRIFIGVDMLADPVVGVDVTERIGVDPDPEIGAYN
jgi:hypothetical protein